MGNEIIYIGTLLLAFAITVLAYRQGRGWLYSWLAVATIISIPTAGMIVDVFGVAVNAGMVLYVASFLGTDMLVERYGKKTARTSVHITTAAVVLFLVFSQLALLLVPESYSTEMYDALTLIFGASTRVAVAGVVSYFISQYLDIWVYQTLRRLTREKHLWLRNNVSTMTTQVIDNVLFFFIAFYGILPNWFELVVAATIFRIGISLLDTPFIYLAARITPRDAVT